MVAIQLLSSVLLEVAALVAAVVLGSISALRVGRLADRGLMVLAIVGVSVPIFLLAIIGAVGDVPGMAARTALVGDISERSGKTTDWLAGASQGMSGTSALSAVRAALWLRSVSSLASRNYSFSNLMRLWPPTR